MDGTILRSLSWLWAALLFIAINVVLQPGPLNWRSPRRFVATLIGLTRLVADDRMRQNHALEHATINVLEDRFGRERVAFIGLARRDGFYLRGPATPALIEEAAWEALSRLSAGEGRLALRPQCGTSVFAANLLLSVTVLIALLGLGRRSPLEVFLWLGAANLAGQRFGRAVQERLTTALPGPDLTVRRVTGRPVMAGFFGRAAAIVPMDFFVETGPGTGGTEATGPKGGEGKP
ncbi:MAG: DUF6391 domain-containing protein [Bacillota bacterium]